MTLKDCCLSLKYNVSQKKGPNIFPDVDSSSVKYPARIFTPNNIMHQLR